MNLKLRINLAKIRLGFWFAVEDVYDNLTGDTFGWYPSYGAETHLQELYNQIPTKCKKIKEFGTFTLTPSHAEYMTLWKGWDID